MRLGLLINPLAGIGGTVGLKGSDGDEIVSEALSRGAIPLAEKRVSDALKDVTLNDDVEIVTVAGPMGQDVLEKLDMNHRVVCGVGAGQAHKTSAEDTRSAIDQFIDDQVDLIVFAGGDGTARDVYSALKAQNKDESIPVIGIPAGCKIHSAVYSTTPSTAAELLNAILNGQPMTLKLAEVMDLDEEAFRHDVVKASCYGYMTVPVDDVRMQVIKQGGVAYDEIALQDIASDIIDSMENDRLYILGGGSTTAAVMDELGLDNTLLGVDVVLNRELAASDADEKQLLRLLEDYPASIIVSVIGGQGYIFGRGNQQISARVIEKVGMENIIVIATNEKLRSLNNKPLLVDTGSQDLDQRLRGTISVVSGYDQKTLMSVS